MKIFIIGAGTMGSAIARVLAHKKHQVFIYDVNLAKARALKKYGVVFDGSLQHLSSADVIIVAVKPYDLNKLNIINNISAKQILISIAAGVSIAKLRKLMGIKKIVRIMPNLGLSVGQGIAAWKSIGLNNREKLKINKIINDFTKNFAVKNESDIDAVTAISGSGPAYFFLLAWSLEQAAKKLGFNPDQSRLLVEKTFSGAAALQKNIKYQDLINQVASKKGTTEAALKVFKKFKFTEIIFKAVKSAQNRAKQISSTV